MSSVGFTIFGISEYFHIAGQPQIIQRDDRGAIARLDAGLGIGQD